MLCLCLLHQADIILSSVLFGIPIRRNTGTGLFLCTGLCLVDILACDPRRLEWGQSLLGMCIAGTKRTIVVVLRVGALTDTFAENKFLLW